MKILNVDDTEPARYAKTRALQHAGFDVMEATTGARALELVADLAPELVLLDVKLPDISGYDVCRTIKEQFPATLVLQTSALFTSADARVRGLEGGADAYLHQPFEPAELIATVRALLRARRAEEALRDSEERLRLAQEAAGIGTWDWDLTTGAITWSAEHHRLHGTPVEAQLDYDTWRRTVLADDRTAFELAMQSALSGGESVKAEYRIGLPDGKTRWMSAVGRVIDARGDGRRMIGVTSDITERKSAEEQQDLMMRELHHRVRNTLATVQAIILATARSTTDLKTFHTAVTGRIGSLAKTHTLLTDRSWAAIALRDLLAVEFLAYEDRDQARISMQGPDVMLPSALAVTLGMAVHELATNAAKYGALSVPAGTVDLHWQMQAGTERTLLIDWVEKNGPVVGKPTREGFGSTLLDRVVAGQIGGRLKREFAPEGVQVHMALDLPDA